MPSHATLRASFLALAALLVAHAGARPVHADSIGTWIGIAPPAGRMEHVAAYDSANDRFIVVLGTYDDSSPVYERDVWTRSFAPFGAWREMLPSGLGSSPVGPVAGRMVYDSQHGRFLMASGSTLTTLDLAGSGAWSTTTIVGTPPANPFGAAAIYDATADRILYFGGDGNTPSNEVWSVELSGAPTWVPLSPSGVPPQGRTEASAAYDAAGARMIIFGGNLAGGLQARDVWALSLEGAPAWTEITPAVPGPDERSNAAVTIDPARNRMLVQGGRGSTADARLWALDLGATPAWSVVTTTGAGAGVRWDHTMSYDPLRDRILVYGGRLKDHSTYPAADLLALDLASGVWTSQTDTRPTPRSGHTAIYDAARQRMILFGGWNQEGEGFGETWSLSMDAHPVWTQLAPTGSPPSSVDHSAVVDPVRQRMLVFDGALSQVWSFDLAGAPAWTQLATVGTFPPSRRYAVAIYDPNDDRMIVYGGLSLSGEKLTDLWMLSLSGTPTWTEFHPGGTLPTGRYRPSGIYDPVGRRMLMFGGDGSSPAGELWSLSLSGFPTWQLLTPSGTSVPRGWGAHAAVYDDSRQRMLLYGGGVGGTFNSASTYALSLAGPLQWSLLLPAGPRPVFGCGQSAIYDSGFDRMVIYGGEYNTGFPEHIYEDAAWSLVFGSTTATPIASLPADVQLFPAVPNPASGDVTLAFALPRAASARLAIYDLAGRKIAEPFSGALSAGRHEVRWTRAARDAAGLGPGVYFSELRVGNQRAARRMVVTR